MRLNRGAGTPTPLWPSGTGVRVKGATSPGERDKATSTGEASRVDHAIAAPARPKVALHVTLRAPLAGVPRALHLRCGRRWPVHGSSDTPSISRRRTRPPQPVSPMRLAFVLAAAAGAAACAGRAARRADCPAVPQEQWLAERIVYRECSVDRPARQVASSRIEYSESGGQTCVRASIEAVVDTTGRVVPSTARIIRASDPVFATAVMSSLDTRRFEPAQRDGKAVPQLVHLDEVRELRRMVVRMGDPLPRGAGRPSC